MLIRKIALAGLLTIITGAAPVWAQENDIVRTVPSVSVPASVSLGGTVVPIKDVTFSAQIPGRIAVSYTHLRAHETVVRISFAVLCL